MFAIPGALGIIVMTYIRPQAFIEGLKGVPLIHIVYLMAAVGFLIDLRTRLLKPRAAPLLWHAIAYYLWMIITLAIARKDAVSGVLGGVIIVFSLFFMVAETVQSFRALKSAAALLAMIGVFLSVVGIHQGTAPKGCFAKTTTEAGVFDGRYCDNSSICHLQGDPGVRYTCEKVGLFGTRTVGLRVRWLGIIEDPNELAMCISLCLPLLIGLYLLRPNGFRLAILVVGGVLIFWCNVYTQSRGGQLVFLAALAVYFVRRYGIRGAIVVGVMAAPVLLFGGRSGAEAEESKMERIEALYVASTLVQRWPLYGCGYSQFGEYNFLTAHNSYALAMAETGVPGLVLFISIMYQSMKAFITATRRYSANGPSRSAYIWGGALMAAQTGLMTGVFFLSFNYSAILWTFMGVCSGFQLACRRHDPEVDFTLKRSDWRNIVILALGITSFLWVYSHWKMAGH